MIVLSWSSGMTTSLTDSSAMLLECSLSFMFFCGFAFLIIFFLVFCFVLFCSAFIQSRLNFLIVCSNLLNFCFVLLACVKFSLINNASIFICFRLSLLSSQLFFAVSVCFFNAAVFLFLYFSETDFFLSVAVDK